MVSAIYGTGIYGASLYNIINISGSSSLVFSDNGNLEAVVNPTGSTTLQFNLSGDISSSIFGSANLNFYLSGHVDSVAEIIGGTALSFSIQKADLSGMGTINGDSDLSFYLDNNAIDANGELIGNSEFQFQTYSIITYFADIFGNTDIIFSFPKAGIVGSIDPFFSTTRNDEIIYTINTSPNGTIYDFSSQSSYYDKPYEES